VDDFQCVEDGKGNGEPFRQRQVCVRCHQVAQRLSAEVFDNEDGAMSDARQFMGADDAGTFPGLGGQRGKQVPLVVVALHQGGRRHGFGRRFEDDESTRVRPLCPQHQGPGAAVHFGSHDIARWYAVVNRHQAGGAGTRYSRQSVKLVLNESYRSLAVLPGLTGRWGPAHRAGRRTFAPTVSHWL